MLQQFRLFKQTTIQSPAGGDNQFLQPSADGENGDEPDADPGRDLLSMALINAALERRIPIFTIKVRLHVAGAAWQVDPVQFID